MTDELNPESNTEESTGGGRSMGSSFNPPPQAPLQNEETFEKTDNFKGESIRFTDHVMAWATVVMALATIAIGILAFRQWRDSKTLNDAASKAAAAADSFKDSAAAIQMSIGNVESDLKITADSSEQSVEAAQEAMRLDQRAWIIINKAQTNFSTTLPLQVTVVVANTGKTPAKQYQSTFVVELLPNMTAPDLSFKSKIFYGSTSGIFIPNQTLTETIPVFRITGKTVSLLTLTDAEMNQINGGTLYLVVFGKVTYNDVFGGKHWIHFCNFIQHSAVVSVFNAKNCTDYNATDNNQE